jgi:hypothetical protein
VQSFKLSFEQSRALSRELLYIDLVFRLVFEGLVNGFV